MKKLFPLLCATLLLCCLVCTASAERIDYAWLGLSFETPTEDTNLYLQPAGETDLQTGLEVLFLNYAAIEPYESALMSAVNAGTGTEVQEAFTTYQAQLSLHYQLLGSVIGYQTERLSEVAAQIPEGATLLGANNVYTYYLCSGAENSSLAEEDKPLLEAARADAQKLLDSVSIIDYVPYEEQLTTSALGSFSTVDMAGNPVDTSVFAQADLTVLHVWGTYCSPCINEMPQLAAWAKTLPENVQVIGLICDVESTSDKTFKTAEKILSRSGAGFTNILCCRELLPFLQTVTGVPTTFFIDR